MDKKKISSIVFSLSIFAFIIAFNFSHNPPSGWYQQFLPNLNGQPLSDVVFVDSLNGFAITDNDFATDTGYIIKTTNGGDNWNIVFADNRDYKAIQFLDLNTGYVCGAKPFSGSRLLKTTNSGLSWFDVNPPDAALVLDNISVLNEDTIWLVAGSELTGGVFRTTNGGTNWQVQYSQPVANPLRIYMFNARIGFMDGGGLKKTTNGGVAWFSIPGEGQFFDMCFIDSLTGWKSGAGFKFTSNGGINWTTQTFPQGGEFLATGIVRFSVVNRDTLWGVGGIRITSSGNRGIIYKTTNGGNTWGYQLPDLNINIFQYVYIKFVNKLNGWVYSINSGAHTVTGGDSTTIYTGVKSKSNVIADKIILKQNYPNPFNPTTTINYELGIASFVVLKIYNIQGKEIITLVSEKKNRGNYKITFDAAQLPSGVFFYSLYADDPLTGSGQILVDTKKMIVVR